ncbi:MAG: GIY-YIG nuclease family protein [Acuticoccus sp.]
MKGEARKAAINVYRDRKVVAGIYAVRCAASNEVWVGRAPDVPAIGNRLRFELGQGAHRHRAMQDAWRRHGADNFSIDLVERLDPDDLGLAMNRVLKARHAFWVEELGAGVL